MGKALQIRVSAVTWNEDLLEKLWPKLTELAFSVPIKHEKHGVFDMVRALDDGLQFLPCLRRAARPLAPAFLKPQGSRQILKLPWQNGSPARPTS